MHPGHIASGFISEARNRDHPLSCQTKLLKRRLYLEDSVSFSVYSFYSSTDTPSGSNAHWVSLWDRDLQNFGPKAKNKRRFLLVPVCLSAVTTQGVEFLDLGPWCLRIFAAVATNISETLFHGSTVNTAAWTAAGNHSSVAEPSRCRAKRMLWALVCRCGNVFFLLKELLGHGLATQTLNMNAWLFLLVLVCLSSSDHARVELVPSRKS